ncbi:MAG: glycosyltransferase [Solirubrobacterales bacterium]|nr:glycosyltransferase [Solirubrobacterales bacterium]
MGPTGLVSVVMPVFDPHEPWLRAAVASVLGQRSCAVELVVVDDGCDEPIADTLTGIDDERLRVVRVAHGGVSAARDAGLAASRGRWVRYTDADDVLEAGSTARLLRLSVAAGGAIAYGATVFCDENLRPVWTMRCRLGGRVARACLLGRFTVRLQALLFPREIAERAGGWFGGLRVSEDWDFVLRALELADVRGERQPAVYYRRHPAGLTSHPEAGIDDVRLVVERYLDRHPEMRGTSLERRSDAMVHALGARIAATRGDRGAAGRHLGAAMLGDPRAIFGELRRSAPALRARLSAAPAGE